MLVLLLLISPLTGCLGIGGGGDQGPFTIKNLGVNFGDYNNTTHRAGDFILSHSTEEFLEFGAEVQSSEGGMKILPTFEYRIHDLAEVFTIASGKVTWMDYQEDTEDYEISVTFGNIITGTTVSYDHISNPTVVKGDIVEAGHVLGNPGTWRDDGVGRFEIMINAADGYSYCPFVHFDSELTFEYQLHVAQLMADIEAFEGDSTVYDEDNMAYPGCNFDRYETS